MVGPNDSFCVSADDTYRYYFHDMLGSTRRLRNENKQALSYYEYIPYGQQYSKWSSGGDTSYQFTGAPLDDDYELYYFACRYYNPGVARWMTSDPIGQAAGINTYAYVSGNPTNFTDLLGLLEWYDQWIKKGANLAAGFGDKLTSGFGLSGLFGLPSATEWVRQQIGVNDVVDFCSGWYRGGEVAGYAWLGAFAAAEGYAVGVRVFAHGGREWHVGLELVGKLNLIHLGNSAKWGIHVTAGYVGPMAGWFHLNFQQPFGNWTHIEKLMEYIAPLFNPWNIM